MINFKKLLKSFDYALYGINYAFSSDQNLIIHLVAATIVIASGIILQVTPYEMGLLVLTILFVISTEMINTAIEKTVDLVTREHRIEAKIAKDISSGMVLVSAIGAIIIGLFIFVPYLTP